MLNELAYACQEGLTLEGPDGAIKNFNVIVVFVPDLSCFDKCLGMIILLLLFLFIF